MAKSKMTTAQHRSIAFEAAEKGDYLTAYKHYNLAARYYPSFNPKSALHVADVANLKKRRDQALKMLRTR